jgi:hypothetical protein
MSVQAQRSVFEHETRTLCQDILLAASGCGISSSSPNQGPTNSKGMNYITPASPPLPSWPEDAASNSAMLVLLVVLAICVCVALEIGCWRARGIGLCGIFALCPGRIARHTAAMVVVHGNPSSGARSTPFRASKIRVFLRQVLTPAERELIPV